MRLCRGCDRELELTEFSPQSNGPLGRRTRCRRCCVDANRARTPEYRREVHRKSKYGITPEQFETMARAQNYCCLVCGRDPDVLHVDHDHATGRVRALLCSGCNQALGLLREDTARIKGLALYAELMCSPTPVA